MSDLIKFSYCVEVLFALEQIGGKKNNFMPLSGSFILKPFNKGRGEKKPWKNNTLHW